MSELHREYALAQQPGGRWVLQRYRFNGAFLAAVETVAEFPSETDARAYWEQMMTERAAAQKGETVMYPGKVFVDVWNCRARVARYEQLPDGGMTWNYAANWEDLEDEAAAAVDAAGGWITASGHYPCPAELAERAVWPEQVADT